MESLYEKYKSEINEVIAELEKLVKLYDEVLKKDPKDNKAYYEQDDIQLYINRVRKDLKDMPNRDDEYTYYIEGMKNKLKKFQKFYTDNYNKTFTKTENDAKIALEKTKEILRGIVKDLRAYNNKFYGEKHRDNIHAVAIIKELTDLMPKYDNQFSELQKSKNPNYDQFVVSLEKLIPRYQRIYETIVKGTFIGYSDKNKIKSTTEPQPGE